MLAYGDVESVNLGTGEQQRHVAGHSPLRISKKKSIHDSPEAWEKSLYDLENRQKRRTQMHYRNGREAKNGDKIVSLGFDGGKIVAFGILYDAVPGNDYCNGSIAPTATTGACLCDCLHADDVAELIKKAGLDKRPAGK